MQDQSNTRRTLQSSSYKRDGSGATQKQKIKDGDDAQEKKEVDAFFLGENMSSNGQFSLNHFSERMLGQKVYDEVEEENNEEKDTENSNVCSQICGMILFSLSMVLFSFMSMLIKICTKKFLITAYEITYWQALFCLVYMSINIKIHKQTLTSIPSNSYVTVVKRVFFGVLTDVFANLAFQYTSYSKGICIMFLNTILIPFFSACILGDKVKKLDIVAIIMSFVGMFLIIQPWGDHSNNQNWWNDAIGTMSACLCAVVSTLAIVYQKRLADSLHFTQMNLIYMISSTLMCPIFSFIQQRDVFPIYSSSLFLYIFLIATCFFLMMVCMTLAIKRLPASVSGILLYISIPTSYIFDYVFLHTPIGGIEILGAAIIVGTNVGIAILLACGCMK